MLFSIRSHNKKETVAYKAQFLFASKTTEKAKK